MEPELQREADKQNPKSPTTKNIYTRPKTLLSNITVEPIVLFFVFPNLISFIVTQNINLKKACEVNLNYNTSVCDALAARNKSGYDVTQEQNVQVLVALVNGYSSGLQAFLVCLTLMIIGSWSDKNHRRKPILMLPLIGDSVSALLLLLSLYKKWPIEFNIFAEAVPQGIAGGWYSFTAAIFTYINEDPDVKRRTIKIGTTNVLVMFAFFTGTAAGGLLYASLDHHFIYLLVVIMHLLGVAYVYFKIDEIRHVQEKERSQRKRNALWDVCRLSHVKNTFKTIITKGGNERRKKILLLLISTWGNFGVFHGEKMLVYLYTRYRFGWSEVDYSIFMTYSFIISVIGVPFWLMVCIKLFKLEPLAMGIIATIAKISSTFIYAFATNKFTFYFGLVVEVANGMTVISLRTLLSKMVSAEEQGRLTAASELVEVSAMLIYGPLYSAIYRATIGFFPGTFFLISSTLIAIVLSIFLWMYNHQKEEKTNLELNAGQSTGFLENNGCVL